MYIGPLPPVSNKANYYLILQVSDDETGDLIDLSSATIVFALQDPRTKSRVLSASVDDGIDVIGNGVFSVSFTAATMKTLRAQEYEVGCTIEIADFVEQYIIGTLPVLDGVVP